MPEVPKDLIAASSFSIILLVLRREESYGYEIIKHIREKSNGKLEFAEGTLYPILKKMELEGWIQSQWKTADSGRERKYYKITRKGIKQIELEKKHWQSVNQILEQLWATHLTLSMQ
jgi:PadR family transcriptional regulator, regulatory protein PadR